MVYRQTPGSSGLTLRLVALSLIAFLPAIASAQGYNPGGGNNGYPGGSGGSGGGYPGGGGSGRGFLGSVSESYHVSCDTDEEEGRSTLTVTRCQQIPGRERVTCAQVSNNPLDVRCGIFDRWYFNSQMITSDTVCGFRTNTFSLSWEGAVRTLGQDSAAAHPLGMGVGALYRRDSFTRDRIYVTLFSTVSGKTFGSPGGLSPGMPGPLSVVATCPMIVSAAAETLNDGVTDLNTWLRPSGFSVSQVCAEDFQGGLQLNFEFCSRLRRR
jgi:hypothetical protein